MPSVGVRAGLPEAGDRAIDHVGRDRADCLIADAQPASDAGAVALQEDVAVLGQRQHRLAAGLLFQVNDDGLLAAVAGDEGGGAVAAAAAERARPVALRRLDLDDGCAVMAQQHGAERPGQTLGHIDDAQALEGQHGGGIGYHEA